MKGISAVLATVLIVVITVAIIGLAYGWATGIFKVASTSSQQSTQNEINSIQKSVDIIAATCVSSDSITGGANSPPNTGPVKTNTVVFTIKNTGTSTITAQEMTVFFDNELQSNIITDDIPIDASDQYSFTTGIEGPVKLKINVPAGSVEEDVTCPDIP